MSNKELLEGIGAKIKAGRLAKEMTLQQMADTCKISLAAYWFIENGRRNVHILTLKSISDQLGISIVDLMQ